MYRISQSKAILKLSIEDGHEDGGKLSTCRFAI